MVLTMQTERPTDGMLHVRGLHPAQREIFQSPARFKAVSAGRRFGKTRLGVIMSYCKAALGYRTWWVGPTYPVASIAWRSLRQTARIFAGAEVHESDRRITLNGGGWIQVKSADNPDSLRGEGLDLAIMDEAAYMPEAAWVESIRPALSDYKGNALFISTPAGRNWFWRLWQGATGIDWARFQFPTAANPFIAASEIEAARLSLPERVFQQEYLAKFVEAGAGVFRRVLESATAAPQDRAIAANSATKQREHQYAFGVDWGKVNDFTVIAVLDLTDRAIVALDRFNKIDYTLQRERLRALCERFKPVCIVAESNSMGEPIIEQLQHEGLPVEPFLTSNATKAAAIEAVALGLERDDLRIVKDETLIGELLAYESTRLPSGLTRYGAPAGMHDDCVMAVAMAWTQAGPEGRRMTGII